MRPGSIRIRSAIALSVIVTGLWLATALLTARLLSDELDEVFDSALQETGQRILQLAVVDILSREEDVAAQHLAALGPHEEYFTYVVRDAVGAVLQASQRAAADEIPRLEGPGFHQTGAHRYYQEAAVSGSVVLTIAEPLAHRREVAQFAGLVRGDQVAFAPVTWADLVAQWARTPGDAERRSEVALIPIDGWQLFYYRGGAWSNALSSVGTVPWCNWWVMCWRNCPTS